MEFQNFKLEIDEQGVAVFTADRPEKMNALDDAVSYTHLDVYKRQVLALSISESIYRL